MFATLLVVLPIFALIGIGYACRPLGILGPHATRELNRFVVYLGLPALLFDIMAHTHWTAIYQPAFIGAYAASSLLVFVATLLVRRRRPLQLSEKEAHSFRSGESTRSDSGLADASLDALNAAYCNTGYIGLPLCLIVFGTDSLPSATIAAIITVCVVFALAIVLIEIDLQTDTSRIALASKVGRSLAKNPLLVAPALGAVVAGTGIPLPDSLETIFKLLGATASPCALVALGLFLAEDRPSRAGDLSASLVFAAFKLLLHPVLAWGLGVFVFGVAPKQVPILVVLTALPTGTGPFMLAEYYGREATVTSRTILISTVGSLLSVSAYLAWLA